MAKEEKELSTELRLLIAFALSFAVVLGSRYLFLKQAPPAEQKPAATATKTQPAAPAAPAAPAEANQAAAPPVPAELKQGAAEQLIRVESDVYQLVFSSRGGVAKSWSLKDYRDEQNNPLDVIDSAGAAEFGDPLSIWADDEAVRKEVNGALFVPSTTGQVTAPATLTFEYRGARVAARKEISLSAKSYLVEIKSDLWVDGKPMAHTIAWRGGFGDVHDLGMRGNVVDVFYREPQKMVRLNPGDIKGQETSASGQFAFAGIEDRFFAGAFLPPQPPEPAREHKAAATQYPMRLIAFHHEITVPGQQKKRPSVGVAVGSLESPQNNLRVFVGPKDTELMAKIEPQLPDLVDYGWFAVVAKPLFVAMRWIHDHIVRNYGWSIILLTVFINFALFPLKVKSLRSGMKMQKLQPQIKAIQDKYKQYKLKDPRKADMNRELMDLYKKHGVNPLGGCLPMLLQMPFLYGFYKVLVVSIEMRHAPWVGWITDLSAPEHIAIKILPLAMCATQFWLQKMSPATSPDPAQQKVMLFMPIMFLFLFWNLSSGLVLYWLTGNVVGIAQQWYINKTELQQLIAERNAKKKKQPALRK